MGLPPHPTVKLPPPPRKSRATPPTLLPPRPTPKPPPPPRTSWATPPTLLPPRPTPKPPSPPRTTATLPTLPQPHPTPKKPPPPRTRATPPLYPWGGLYPCPTPKPAPPRTMDTNRRNDQYYYASKLKSNQCSKKFKFRYNAIIPIRIEHFPVKQNCLSDSFWINL